MLGVIETSIEYGCIMTILAGTTHPPYPKRRRPITQAQQAAIMLVFLCALALLCAGITFGVFLTLVFCDVHP